jgi:phenylpropionate dioxygenase-like ring-hydroxylating dioxygenase large terminal subunit
MTSPNTTQGTADPIQSYLDKGLRNYWYPVAPSWQVGDAPVGITRLGDQIVLWRDKEGKVHALEDRCPHRGARLSLGWNLGGSVACWYHGIEIDGSGEVTKVPAVSNCPLEGQKCVKSYPVEEHAGAIFLWFGDEAHKEPTPLVLPEELVGEEYASFLCMSNWKCNYQYAIDNVMDPMHGAYLHATSHSMAEGDKQADMRVRKTETGLMFEKVGQRDVNFDWVELGETGTLWMRLAIPYKKKFGPGGNFGIIGFATPVDGDNCQVYFWRTRKVSGLATRRMAFPVPQPPGRSALGGAGARPLRAGKHGAERAQSRVPVSARRRHDAGAPHVASACTAGLRRAGSTSR